MSNVKRIVSIGLLILAKTALFGGLFLLAAGAGSVGYFEFGSPEQTCLSCHELRTSYDHWSQSAHRDVTCKQCHGGTVISGWHGAKENFKRLVAHFRDPVHDDMRLSEEQAAIITDECRRCHASEFAHWQHGGHGVDYSDIFLHEQHNTTEQLAEDCLRCHGMFFQGSIGDLVEPLDTMGPWRLKDASQSNRPTVPCLACHQVHVAGHTAADRRNEAKVDEASAVRRASVSFYCRRERTHFPAVDLPLPKIVDGERTVLVSSDPRQRVCIQCHAPDAFGRAGSGDDRTPVGVHEGLSCLACHAAHSNDARASCSQCHPTFSNCGIDVTTMDTTFRWPQSRHNIHRVHCADCHPSGVPKSKSSAEDS